MTLALSFTASRTGFSPAPAMVLNVLAALPRADRYITGGCTGGDAFIGRWLYLRYPDAEHFVVIPADRSRVDPWWEDYLPWHLGLTAIGRLEMPPGSTYKDRNTALAEQATWTSGFPAYPEHDPRSRRSGSWQAIRMARTAGKLAEWHCIMPPYAGRIEHYIPGRAGGLKLWPGIRRWMTWSADQTRPGTTPACVIIATRKRC